MNKLLVNLGLAIVPFFIWSGFDTRQPKMFLAVFFALALSLQAIYQGSRIKVSNKYALILIAYLFFNVLLIPGNKALLNDVSVGTFWIWEGLFQVLTFFLFFGLLSNAEYKKEDMERSFKVMACVASILCFYSIFQSFGIDQFFGSVAHGRMFYPQNCPASFGSISLLSTFLAILCPVILYLKKYWLLLIMGIVLFFLNIQTAQVVAVFSVLFVYFSKTKKRLAVLALIVILGISGIAFGIKNNEGLRFKFSDGGRFGVWKSAVEDINKNQTGENIPTRYPLSGYGMGAFKYFFHANHKDPIGSSFLEAHNDFVEFLYNTGFIGFILLLFSIGLIVKDFMFSQSFLERCLFSSFVASVLCACTLFVWQMGAHIYYTLVVLAFLYNRKHSQEAKQ